MIVVCWRNCVTINAKRFFFVCVIAVCFVLFYFVPFSQNDLFSCFCIVTTWAQFSTFLEIFAAPSTGGSTGARP